MPSVPTGSPYSTRGSASYNGKTTHTDSAGLLSSLAQRIPTREGLPLPAIVCLWLVLLFVGPIFTPLAHAQILDLGGQNAAEGSGQDVDRHSEEQITTRLKEVRDEQLKLNAITDPQQGNYVKIARERLEQIARLLETQLSVATELGSAGVTEDASPEPGAASVFVLNTLYEERASAGLVLEEKRANLNAVREKLEKAKKAHKALKQREGGSVPEEADLHQEAVKLSSLTVRLFEEEEVLAVLEVRAAAPRAEKDGVLSQRIGLLREQLAAGEAEASGAGMLALSKRMGALERLQEDAKRRLRTADMRLEASRVRQASAPINDKQLQVEVEALSIYRDVLGEKISLHTAQRERLESQKTIWSNWQAVLGTSHTREDLHAWARLGRERLEMLRLDTVQAQVRSSELLKQTESLQARMIDLPEGSPTQILLSEALAEVANLHAEQLAELRSLASDERLTRRFLDDVDSEIGNFSLLEFATSGIDYVLGLWNYEITTIDDAPFTLGSLTLGLLLFCIGLWISRKVSAAVGHFAEERLRLDAGAANALQSLSFYALLIGITLLALRTVHFPLTAFAFLGGALAIGIGFGSQNVMNNFISGLILMLERPVRARDVVEVEGKHGTIQKIGARSTQIRSTDGRHIIVPNSFFLESNVINWTLSDDLIRAKVAVGVCYGSPTRLVKQLIQEVVESEKLVLPHPKPIVIFQDFGDSALNFEVYFWVRARSPMGVAEIESQIRYRIDDLFRENDLVIAFPQRDLHLDSLKPIEVRMVDDSSTENGGEK